MCAGHAGSRCGWWPKAKERSTDPLRFTIIYKYAGLALLCTHVLQVSHTHLELLSGKKIERYGSRARAASVRRAVARHLLRRRVAELRPLARVRLAALLRLGSGSGSGLGCGLGLGLGLGSGLGLRLGSGFGLTLTCISRRCSAVGSGAAPSKRAPPPRCIPGCKALRPGAAAPWLAYPRDIDLSGGSGQQDKGTSLSQARRNIGLPTC